MIAEHALPSTRRLPDYLATRPSIELSIVMPCFNEAETIMTCVRKARAWIEQRTISAEIIVADNGSTDGSPLLAEAAGARVVAVAQPGYGNALLGGIQAANGTYIIMGDADDSYDFTQLDAFLGRLREGFELVMGNRFTGGIAPGAMPPLHRYLGNPLLSGLGRLFFHCPIGDFHCGLRAFRKEAIDNLHLCASGMEFASEMVVKATLHGLQTTEVPTTLSPDGRSRPPHLRSWRDGWRHLRFLLQYCPRWLFLYPGIVLMMVGVLTGACRLSVPPTSGVSVPDIHMLLSAAMALVVGFQAITFALFAKCVTIREGLHPANEKLERLVILLNLEWGLALGGALTLVGLAGSGYAVVAWHPAALGGEIPAQLLRLLIVSTTVLVLGVQLMLAAFFLSILTMVRR
jgi:Glycosyl transferase family 2